MKHIFLIAPLILATIDAAADQTPTEPLGESYRATLAGGGIVTVAASTAGRPWLSYTPPLQNSVLLTLQLPAGAVVEKAWIYVQTIGPSIANGGPPSTLPLTLDSMTNGNSVELIGAVSDGSCWGPRHRHFRWDVSDLVAGDGDYVLAGFPNSTSADTGDSNGVTLLVVYRDGGAATTDLVISDGIYQTVNTPGSLSTVLTAVTPHSKTTLYSVVGDGSHDDNTLDVVVNALNVFSVANAYPGTAMYLYDLRVDDVSSFLPAGQQDVTVTIANNQNAGAGPDCIVPLIVAWQSEALPPGCGNGIVEGAEECDAGSVAVTCCTEACTFKAATAECRPSSGACDLAEVCDGVSSACPVDGKSTAQCRAAAGVCDTAETCDGVQNNCPADIFVANGTGCDDADVCNGHESCQNGVCAPGNSLDCDDNDACTSDVCNTATGCQHSGSCSDGGPTGGDSDAPVIRRAKRSSCSALDPTILSIAIVGVFLRSRQRSGRMSLRHRSSNDSARRNI